MTEEERRVLIATAKCVDWIICEMNGKANMEVVELRSAVYDLDPPEDDEEDDDD